MNALLALAVPDNSSYGMPTWAIIIACVWAAIVIVLHGYAFVKAKTTAHNQPTNTGRHVTTH